MTERMSTKLVADILKTVMALDDGQIWIHDPRRQIPTSDGPYIVVGLVDVSPYGVNLKNVGVTTETRAVWTKETIQIDMFSRDTSAITRLPELIGALNSTFSIQTQEQYGFKIASVPTSVNNTSEIEGSTIPYRFTVTTVVLRAYNNTGAITYYDTFSSETHNEDGKQ